MSSNSGIKAVVFDFGGVIIDLYQEKTSQRLNEFIPKEKKSELMSLALEIELGKISREDFLIGVQGLSEKEVSKEEVEAIWNLMLCEIKDEKVQFLKSLKKNYEVYLLSNTNIVHKIFFDKICLKAFGESMETFFDKTFYSHELKMRKPDAEIFEYILSQINHDPSEVLFIDDLSENTDSALKLGMQAHQFEKNSSFESLSFLKV
jgi:putative hydrolase of the HAD superfamily